MNSIRVKFSLLLVLVVAVAGVSHASEGKEGKEEMANNRSEFEAIRQVQADIRNLARKMMKECGDSQDATRVASLAINALDLPLDSVKAAIIERSQRPEHDPKVPSMTAVVRQAYANILPESTRHLEQLYALKNDEMYLCRIKSFQRSVGHYSEFIIKRYLWLADFE